MRDPNRIDNITTKLNEVWKQVPDLRFWQLIMYILEYTPEDKLNTDPFFWEENVWASMLDTMIKNK